MGTTNETVVNLSEGDKSLLKALSAMPPKGYAAGGYTTGGIVSTPTEHNDDVLREIRDLLKDIRDQRRIEISTPAPPSQFPWVPYTPPYPVQPYPTWMTYVAANTDQFLVNAEEVTP